MQIAKTKFQSLQSAKCKERRPSCIDSLPLPSCMLQNPPTALRLNRGAVALHRLEKMLWKRRNLFETSCCHVLHRAPGIKHYQTVTCSNSKNTRKIHRPQRSTSFQTLLGGMAATTDPASVTSWQFGRPCLWRTARCARVHRLLYRESPGRPEDRRGEPSARIAWPGCGLGRLSPSPSALAESKRPT